MAYAGFRVSEYQPSGRQLTTFSSKDTWDTAESKPRLERDVSAESIRSRNISTSENLFGGSSNCGNWRRTDDPDPNQKQIHKSVHEWSRTRKAAP